MFCHMVAYDIESKVEFGSRQKIAVRPFNQIKSLKKNIYSTFFTHKLIVTAANGSQEQLIDGHLVLETQPEDHHIECRLAV